MTRLAALLALVYPLALGACSRPAPPGPAPGPSARPAGSATAARFEVGWDARTGKGPLRQRYDDGAVASVCLQCGFPGYTGGLVIGSFSGSGFEYRPPRPLRGYETLNVFCAQDESIWDRASSAEYAFGWSENFGTGPDGRRLEYVSGEISERGPGRVLLRARNRGGCYEVDKSLFWPAEARYLVIGTAIRNVCPESVSFDFWTGDDPWLGRYRSSEGDVGYTDRTLVRVESRIEPREFRFGGVYDLGNSAAGEREGGFSGAANFIMPRPGGRAPDRIYFANRFAHGDDEIHPGRPLDNKSMLAVNLGWLGLELAPGASASFVYALGLAHASGEPRPPQAPSIPAQDWSAIEPAPSAFAAVRFDSERIELHLGQTELEVRGRYVLAHDGERPTSIGIHYPFPEGALHPPPHYLALDGRVLTGFPASGARFAVDLPARGTASFEVVYRQRHGDHSATYIVTSARRWGRPIRRAEFLLRYPRAWRSVHVSYPADAVRPRGDEIEYRFARTDFVPGEDVVVSWQ
ncbi:MAG: hypothetical protein HY744_33925 [Deltaproteobacteria bacterium]|nr:hypothetical protein [Deltaproteobacteria bacterium]